MRERGREAAVLQRYRQMPKLRLMIFDTAFLFAGVQSAMTTCRTRKD
jgi:hypothetical protein